MKNNYVPQFTTAKTNALNTIQSHNQILISVFRNCLTLNKTLLHLQCKKLSVAVLFLFALSNTSFSQWLPPAALPTDPIHRPGWVGVAIPFLPSAELHMDGTLLFDDVFNFSIDVAGNRFIHNNNNASCTFVGLNSGAANVGNENSFFGERAGAINTTGDANSFFGFNAGFFNSSGRLNTFMGTSAGFSNTTGESNSFFGQRAGTANTTGSRNTFLGTASGLSNANSNDNTFVGFFSGNNNTTGSTNTFLGSYSGFNNTAGIQNTYVGFQSGFQNSAGTRNVAMGNNALLNNASGSFNISIGVNSLVANTSGERNIAIGTLAGSSLTTPVQNIIIGDNALQNASSDFRSVIIGTNAFQNTGSGVQNVGIGYSVGINADVNDDCVFVGPFAGQDANFQSLSVFLGAYAGADATSGSQNTYVGSNSGGLFTTEGGITAIGSGTASFNGSSGNFNTMLGTSAVIDNISTTVENSSAIGAFSSVCESDVMVLGNHNTSIAPITTVVIGNCQPTSGTGSILEVHGDAAKSSGGPFWTVFSDKRLKKDIEDFTLGLSTLNKIKPVTFKYDKSSSYVVEKASEKETIGIIAQDLMEIEEIAKYTVLKSEKTGYYSYDANAMLYLLINSVKEQQIMIDSLSGLIAEISANCKNNREEQNSQTTQSLVSPTNDIENTIVVVLKQNRPNPFSETTTIEYELTNVNKSASIIIMDFDGKTIKEFKLLTEKGEVTFNSGNLTSGIYFYGLFIEGKPLEIKKMIVAK